MFRFSLFFTILFLLSQVVYSQVAEHDIFQRLEQSNPSEGRVTIYQEKGIADLVKLHEIQNEKLAGVEGWRIQLYSGSGSNAKKDAQDTKGRAMTEFPEQKVYLIYNAPFWLVRVGDFRDKSESLRLYYQLKKTFQYCYPVKDDNVQLKGFNN